MDAKLSIAVWFNLQSDSVAFMFVSLFCFVTVSLSYFVTSYLKWKRIVVFLAP